MPYPQYYTATGTGFIAPGQFDSGPNIFVVPNFAYSSPIDANSAWGVAVYGNGGMNTDWPTMTNRRLAHVRLAAAASACSAEARPAST